MTLREAAAALTKIVQEHPEIADLELEFMGSEWEHDLEGSLWHVTKTWETQEPDTSPIPKIGQPFKKFEPKIIKHQKTSLLWDHMRPDEGKVLAEYPLEPR